MTTGNLITAIVFFMVAGGIGACLMFFAGHIRDSMVKQLQKRWPVLFYRALGGCMLAGAVFMAWSFVAYGPAPAARSQLPSVVAQGTGEPLVHDPQSAIRIARALQLAQPAGDPANRTEAQWMASCKATLIDGIWHVKYRGRPATISNPHYRGPEPGFCTGASDFRIGAQDGRFLGASFFD